MGTENPLLMPRRIDPTLKFILLVFVVAYTIGFGLQWLCPSPSGLAWPYLRRIGVTYAPTVAALLMVGKGGIRGLLGKLDPRGRLFWVPILMTAGVACTALAALAAGITLEELSRTAGRWPAFAGHALLQFVFVGCGEEVGWRGWLLPRLIERHRTVVATVIVAAVWGGWHVFILLSGLRTAAAFLFGVFGLSVLFTALWQRVQGNIFVLAVAHASVNAPLSLLVKQSVVEAVFVLYGLLGLAVLASMTLRSTRMRSTSDGQLFRPTTAVLVNPNPLAVSQHGIEASVTENPHGE